MALGRLWVCGHVFQHSRARPLHLSAIRFAFAPIEHLRAIATPVVGPYTPTNGEHAPNPPSELARKISAEALPNLSHSDQPAWAEVTSVGAAKEFTAKIG